MVLLVDVEVQGFSTYLIIFNEMDDITSSKHIQLSYVIDHLRTFLYGCQDLRFHQPLSCGTAQLPSPRDKIKIPVVRVYLPSGSTTPFKVTTDFDSKKSCPPVSLLIESNLPMKG
jgi:hypothetical protein